MRGHRYQTWCLVAGAVTAGVIAFGLSIQGAPARDGATAPARASKNIASPVQTKTPSAPQALTARAMDADLVQQLAQQEEALRADTAPVRNPKDHRILGLESDDIRQIKLFSAVSVGGDSALASGGGTAAGGACTCDSDCSDTTAQLFCSISAAACAGPANTQGGCPAGQICAPAQGCRIADCIGAVCVVTQAETDRRCGSADSDFCTDDRCVQLTSAVSVCLATETEPGSTKRLNRCAKECSVYRNNCDTVNDCAAGIEQCVIKNTVFGGSTSTAYCNETLDQCEVRPQVCTLSNNANAGTMTPCAPKCSISLNRCSGTFCSISGLACTGGPGQGSCTAGQTCDSPDCASGQQCQSGCGGTEVCRAKGDDTTVLANARGRCCHPATGCSITFEAACTGAGGTWYRLRDPDDLLHTCDGSGTGCPKYSAGTAPPETAGEMELGTVVSRTNRCATRGNLCESDKDCWAFCTNAPTNAACTALQVPFNCCTGLAQGTCPALNGETCDNDAGCGQGGNCVTYLEVGHEVCAPVSNNSVCTANVTPLPCCTGPNAGTCLKECTGATKFKAMGDDYKLANGSHLKLEYIKLRGATENPNEVLVLDFYDNSPTPVRVVSFAVRLPQTGMTDYTFQVDCGSDCDLTQCPGVSCEERLDPPVIIPPQGYIVARSGRGISPQYREDDLNFRWLSTDDTPGPTGATNDVTKMVAWPTTGGAINFAANLRPGANKLIFELLGEKVNPAKGSCCNRLVSGCAADTEIWQCRHCPDGTACDLDSDCGRSQDTPCSTRDWFGPRTLSDILANIGQTCPVPCAAGGCCQPNAVCTSQPSAAACNALIPAGVFQGFGTDCTPNCCTKPDTGYDCCGDNYRCSSSTAAAPLPCYRISECSLNGAVCNSLLDCPNLTTNTCVRHCSVTMTQGCSQNAQCPGGESCVGTGFCSLALTQSCTGAGQGTCAPASNTCAGPVGNKHCTITLGQCVNPVDCQVQSCNDDCSADATDTCNVVTCDGHDGTQDADPAGVLQMVVPPLPSSPPNYYERQGLTTKKRCLLSRADCTTTACAAQTQTCLGHCSITVATSCSIDANCPGGETCLDKACSVTGVSCTSVAAGAGDCQANICMDRYLDDCVGNQIEDKGWYEQFNLDTCGVVTLSLCCNSPVRAPVSGGFTNVCPCAASPGFGADIDEFGRKSGFGETCNNKYCCDDGNFSAQFTLPPGTYTYLLMAEKTCSHDGRDCTTDAECNDPQAPGIIGSACEAAPPVYQVQYRVERCPTAACCLDDDCMLLTRFECNQLLGVWRGANNFGGTVVTSCTGLCNGVGPICSQHSDCGVGVKCHTACISGACCLSSQGNCVDNGGVLKISQDDCLALDIEATYRGGVTCDEVRCAVCPIESPAFGQSGATAQFLFSADRFSQRFWADDWSPAADGLLQRVCWFVFYTGDDGTTDGFECSGSSGGNQPPDDFVLHIYEDDDDGMPGFGGAQHGIPGDLVGNFHLAVDGKLPTAPGGAAWRYTAPVPPLNVVGDECYWIEITGKGEAQQNGQCQVLMFSSGDGNNLRVTKDGDGNCSVTTGTNCSHDDDCPGVETCVNYEAYTVPDISNSDMAWYVSTPINAATAPPVSQDGGCGDVPVACCRAGGACQQVSFTQCIGTIQQPRLGIPFPYQNCNAVGFACPLPPNDLCGNRTPICANVCSDVTTGGKDRRHCTGNGDCPGGTCIPLVSDANLGFCNLNPASADLKEICDQSIGAAPGNDCFYALPVGAAECATRPANTAAYRCFVPTDNRLAATDGPPTTGAGLTVNCSGSGANSFQADTWFQYTAPCTGTLTISMCHVIAYDAMLAVFGDNVPGGTCLCPTDFIDASSCTAAGVPHPCCTAAGVGATCNNNMNTKLKQCNDDFCPGSGTSSGIRLAGNSKVTEGACYTIQIGGWSFVGNLSDAGQSLSEMDIGIICDVVVPPNAPTLATGQDGCTKNRFLSFVPTNGVVPTRYRVKHVNTGRIKWVLPPAGADVGRSYARLQTTMPAGAAFTQPVLHITDCIINAGFPGAAQAYEIAASTNAAGTVFSAPLLISTSKYADIVGPIRGATACAVGPDVAAGTFCCPQGLVNFVDVNAAVQCFATLPSIKKPMSDMIPCATEGLCGFGEVNAIVQAFTGVFTYGGCGKCSIALTQCSNDSQCPAGQTCIIPVGPNIACP